MLVATQPTVPTAVAILGDTPEEAAAAVTEGRLSEGDLMEGVQDGQAHLGADAAGAEQILSQLLSAKGAALQAVGWVKPMASKGEVAGEVFKVFLRDGATSFRVIVLEHRLHQLLHMPLQGNPVRPGRHTRGPLYHQKISEGGRRLGEDRGA